MIINWQTMLNFGEDDFNLGVRVTIFSLAAKSPIIAVKNSKDLSIIEDYFIITIEPEPKIIGVVKISNKQVDKIKRWIRLNYQTLIEHWYDEMCVSIITKELIPVQEETMTQRKQIADCIKYLRRIEGYAPIRGHVEDFSRSYYDSVLLSDLMSYYKDADPSTISISGYSSEDEDGYPEKYVHIEISRKMNDEEYFNLVASYICPTSYQVEEFQQYQRLKAKYE